MKRFGPFFSNVSVESHDATTRCTCGASDAESDRSSTFCSREPCEDIPSEPEFIRSIGASFAIPYSHGELDWLKGLNAELYENPLSSLLEESGEFLPKDHNHVSSQVFESFLDVRHPIPLTAYDLIVFFQFEDDDEGVELTTEDSSSLTQTSFSQDSSCTDRSSYYPSKQIIHVILPQFSQCDTWKKQMPPPFVFPRRRRFLSSSKFSKFVGRLWRKS